MPATSARYCALALALACLCATDAASAATRQHGDIVHRGHTVDGAASTAQDTEVKAVEVDKATDTVVARLLQRKGRHFPSMAEATKVGLEKVNLEKAVQRLQGRLPADVASLVRTRVAGKTAQPFSEDSLAKARKALNEMIEKAWVELDDKLIDCKEFEEKNRGTYDQVTTDISRLSEYLADLARIRAETTEEIAMKEEDILGIMAQLKKETEAYMKIYFENSREMKIRRNDMAVFQFMMVFTKCKAGSLLQLGEAKQPQAKICETDQGLMLNFDDKEAQAKLERMLTPSAMRAVNEVLGQVQAAETKVVAGLMQKGVDDGDDDEEDTDLDEKDQKNTKAALRSIGLVAKRAPEPTMTTTTTMAMPSPAIPTEQVWTGVDVNLKWKECPPGPPDCGLLHDKMSLMWGKFKDLVDELQQEMDKNEFEFEELKTNLNEQLEVLRNSKARFTMELNEAISNMQSTQEMMGEKLQEKAELSHDFRVYMAACKKRIEWILFQDICAFISVRVAVMKTSTECPPEKIVDCDMADWVAGQCSVPCDDTCPDPVNPYACGGFQTLTRTIIQTNNKCGFRCAATTRKKKCNQIKCPVDCKMSKFSAWSDCSAECGGGVRGRTRSILTFPKNGGTECGTAQESENCHTGSCTRNCRLKRWSKWSPCSVACGGGFSEKWRRVTRPPRGKGKCPKADSRYRYRIRKCNTQECAGDEICIATQDLVVSIDASGSLTEDGFKIIKGFAARLMDKYQGTYYGEDDMAISVVQFGNGEILADGSVSPAIDVIQLTNDIAKVKTAIEGLEYKKGFTNMAQAFTVAEKMFLLGGRRKAQSAVMTITDGKPSFLYQTQEKVMQLKDKHVKLFFAPVVEFKGDEFQLMKKWASQPWETHLVDIPGILPLQADEGVFAQKVIVKFCPEAMSPSAMFVEEVEMGYLLVHENALCGPKGELLSKSANYAEDCAALAMGAGAKAFALGIKYARGRCFAMGLDVTKEMVDQFDKDRKNPPCPGGEWKKSGLYDFYVLEQM